MLSLLLSGHPSTRELTREALGAWLEKNEEKPFLRVLAMLLTVKQYREGFERGEAIGERRGLSKAQDWYNRQQAALEKGEPLNEPLPWHTNN